MLKRRSLMGLMMAVLCLQAEAADVPLSAEEMWKSQRGSTADAFGVDEGYLPEQPGPYGDETPDYEILYWEKGDVSVFSFGYGWGDIDDRYIFPLRRHKSWRCPTCFRLTDLSDSIDLGEGSCTVIEVAADDHRRSSCQMKFFGDHSNLGNHTKAQMTFNSAERNDGSSYLSVASFAVTVTHVFDDSTISY